MALTISAPTEVTIIYADEQTGEEQTTVRAYTYDGFAIRNDENIEYKSHYVENNSRTDMVSFYSLSGTFLGSRTYTEDGTYTDYVDMADIQTFDNRFILPRVWRDSAHDCNWGGKNGIQSHL